MIALRLQKERQQDKFLPSMREYSRLFGINQAKLNEAQQPFDRHASGADKSRGGIVRRCCRRQTVGDLRPGDQRSRRAHGGIVFGVGDKNIACMARGRSMGLLIKNAIIVNADKICDKPQDILCEDGQDHPNCSRHAVGRP